jgi:hypothetical protein
VAPLDPPSSPDPRMRPNTTTPGPRERRHISHLSSSRDTAPEQACQAVQALLEGLSSADRLRQENKQLRQRVKMFEAERGNYEAFAVTQYKEEVYERVKSERDQELVERVASQNRIIQKCFADLEAQTQQLHAAQDRVDRKEYDAIVDRYIELQRSSAQKSQSKAALKKQSRLQKAKEELKKAAADLESSDEEADAA